jgi:hypothetical protein
VTVDDDVRAEVAEERYETIALLDELAEIADYLEKVDAKYARRAEILLELRDRPQPVKYRILGAFAGASEEAMLQAYRKAKADAAKAG